MNQFNGKQYNGRSWCSNDQGNIPEMQKSRIQKQKLNFKFKHHSLSDSMTKPSNQIVDANTTQTPYL